MNNSEEDDIIKWSIKDILILIVVLVLLGFFGYLMFAYNPTMEVIGGIIGIPIGLVLGYFMIPLMF